MSRGCLWGVAILLLIGSGPLQAPSVPLPDSVAPCAPCHRGGERNQVGEWLASPYSAPEGGLGCLDCHTGPCRGESASERGGSARSTTSRRTLNAAARLSVKPVCSGEVVTAEVVVANVGVGHLLPTGPTGRRLLLQVTVQAREGVAPLTATDSLSPGRAARVSAVGRSAVAGIGQGTAVQALVTPLAPFGTDVSAFRLSSPDGVPIEVRARLVLVPLEGETVELARAAASCHETGARP